MWVKIYQIEVKRKINIGVNQKYPKILLKEATKKSLWLRNSSTQTIHMLNKSERLFRCYCDHRNIEDGAFQNVLVYWVAWSSKYCIKHWHQMQLMCIKTKLQCKKTGTDKFSHLCVPRLFMLLSSPNLHLCQHFTENPLTWNCIIPFIIKGRYFSNVKWWKCI